jgi:hypothetical protein
MISKSTKPASNWRNRKRKPRSRDPLRPNNNYGPGLLAMP